MAAPQVSWRFVVRMAARELRSSWRRLAFFFVCIAVGVAAIVALRSVIQSVRGALSGQARSMLGADLVVSSNTELTPALRVRMEEERAVGRVLEVSELTELLTMARPADAAGSATRMVELKAVDARFPLHGELTLDDGAYAHGQLSGYGALVRSELLSQLGLRVGDAILLGDAAFTIRGVVLNEPGRMVGAFSAGPRVFIDRSDLAATKLLAFGARASHQLLLRVPESEVDGLATSLREAFLEDFIGVRSFHRTDDQMGQIFARAENYLSLVGLVVLILGGIGVSSVTRVFVEERLRAVAVLKCLGATGSDILAVYLAQTVLLSLAGAVCGVGMAALAVLAMPEVPIDVPGLPGIQYALTWSAVAHGMLAGLVVSVAFALVPLLDVRAVKPALLLRADAGRGQSDSARLVVVGAVGVLLISVAVWQAGSVKVAFILATGLIALALALLGAGRLLVRAVRPWTRSRVFAIRHAALHVVRPGHQTDVILLAVGLGAFFILGVRGLEANLVRDFSLQLGNDAPDMFLLDVQQDQRDRMVRLIDEGNGSMPKPTMMPVLRARVTGVLGREVRLNGVQDVRGRGSLAREYTVTYRQHREGNEDIVDGQWWSVPKADEMPEVSIEESVRDRFGIVVGDVMRFDVLGKPVSARVSSVRRVDFRDFRSGGFMFVFRPDTFADAPHSYMATAQGPTDPEARGRLIASLVSDSPNVSIVDLRDVLQAIRGVAEAVTKGVTAVGGLVLVSGLLILVGAVSATKFRRIYEVAIFRTLGASGGVIAAMLWVEYAILGTIAASMGAIGSVALSWAVATQVLDMPWEPAAGMVASGMVIATVLVAVVGVAASTDVLRRKPLAILRAE